MKLKVEDSLINKIAYLGKVPKEREVGDLWTPMHTVVFYLFLLGGVSLAIGIFLEAIL